MSDRDRIEQERERRRKIEEFNRSGQCKYVCCIVEQRCCGCCKDNNPCN